MNSSIIAVQLPLASNPVSASWQVDPGRRDRGVTWPRPRQCPGRGTGYRLLCIDDESLVLKYLEELLALEGFDVDVAPDGRTGLALALAGRYDALLVDLVLPDLPGLDVIRAVRDSGRSGAIVVFTGRPTVSSAIEATRFGVTYLVKGRLRGAAIVDAVLEAIAAAAPANRPLFRTAPGPSRVVLNLVHTLDAVRARWSVTEEVVRKHVRQECARLLAWFDITFLEFVAAGKAYQVLNDNSLDVAVRLPVVGRHLEQAAQRSWADVDPRLRRVVDQLEAAGKNWKAVDEPTASGIAGVDDVALRRMLGQEIGLTFPRLRWSVVLRRVVLELAAGEEQVAQIAYLVGFSQPGALNEAFTSFFATTPTEYRRLMADGRSSAGEKPKE